MQAERVDDAWASRAAEAARHLRSVRVPDAPAASRPTASQWPVPQASHPAFDVSACCHVRIIAATATLARVQRACQAFSARVHVFVCMASAASAGMAVAGASPVRDMPNCSLCNSFLCGTKRAACILCCAAVRCATPPSPPPLHEQPEDSERSSYSERDTTSPTVTQRILIPHAKQPTKAQGACSRKRERTSLC